MEIARKDGIRRSRHIDAHSKDSTHYFTHLITGTVFLLCLNALLSCHTEEETKTIPTPLFELLPPTITGVNFENTLKPDINFNILEYDYFYNGGGVGAGDFNQDGLMDIYFTGNQVSSKLYLNKGDFQFEDVTEQAGVGTRNWATGVAIADVNNDGLQDIYVCYAGHLDASKRINQLFINQGIKEGKPFFSEEAAAYGIAVSGYSTQAAFFDYDRDGDLDLYVANHDRSKLNPNNPQKKVNDGTANSTDKLLKNEGGKFVDVSSEAGITHEGYGLGITIGDINMDGWPDVYVANDFIFDDLLYINNGNGTFTESIRKYIQHTSRFSMGCDIADYNNDAYPDIVVLDMLPADNKRQKLMGTTSTNYLFEVSLRQGYLPQYVRNMLQLNNGPDRNGDYSFSEIGRLAGVYKTDWSWSPLFADFDNDGWKDLFITNGIPRDITNNDFVAYRDTEISLGKDTYTKRVQKLLAKVDQLEPVNIPNRAFKNNGDLTFTDQCHVWGLTDKGFSNGGISTDLDNDGDLDIVVNNLNAKPFIYKNNSEQKEKNNFLRIKFTGAIQQGVNVYLHHAGTRQFQELSPTRGFESSQENIIHFGMGKERDVDTLEINWTDGKQQILTNIAVNQVLTIDHKNSSLPSRKIKVKDRPVFKEITYISGLDFVHRENIDFEDFDHEPLLPHRFSRSGPCLAAGDVDGNGLEDVFVGGSAKIAGYMFFQQPSGKFVVREMPDPGFEDTAALLFDADSDNDLDLFVVSGGNEYNALSPPYQDRLYINDGNGNFTRNKKALPAEYSSGSCVSAGDFDNDGDLDLFVGGRVVPGNYPAAPESFILQNNGKGNFTDATLAIAPAIKNLGMITAATWTDFDGDSLSDLVLVGEFMPICLFKNNRGKLNLVEELSHTLGWWNTIAGDDFDKDGDIDFMVGNLGLNNKYEAAADHPVTLYGIDINHNDRYLSILTYYINGTEYTDLNRDQIASRYPGIKARFKSYQQFATATFHEIFTEKELEDAKVLKASYFKSIYLQNNGRGKFDIKPLPLIAQFSTVQAIAIKDFDGDGNLDALLAGNSFNADYTTGRYDASSGVLLKGNGKGAFEVVSKAKSGLDFQGEVRQLKVFSLKDKVCVLGGVNSLPLQIFQLNPEH